MKPASRTEAGKVRIIGGRWRGTRLSVPSSPGLRPSSDRVRETLFNWLMPVLPGASVLDLFSGTGALGLEAVSRGAARAVLVERDAALAQALRDVSARLSVQDQVEVVQAEAVGWLQRQTAGSFDLVLLDPPFGTDLAEHALPLATRLAAADGLIYLEARQALAVPPPGWDLHRQGRAGAVHFHLLRRTGAATLAASVPRSSP